MLLNRSLTRLDSRSSIGPWTASVLQLIFRKPSVRATDLAQDLGQDRDDLKVKVRKLKALGLTESRSVGYKLSARGVAVLRRLQSEEN